MGWRTHIRPARPSTCGGWHGGAGAIAQKGICCKRYLRAAPQGSRNPRSGESWFFLKSTTKGFPFGVGVVCLILGLGLIGDRILHLQEFAGFLRAFGVLSLIL
eukprot:6077934-Pyramimonas_sp.AAC.1